MTNLPARVKQHVAPKILTADSYGHGNDTFEIDILKHIRNEAVSDPRGLHILQLLDSFQHNGPNGAHACLVFPAMGPDMSKYRRLFPKLRISTQAIQIVSRQLLLALSFLHDTCRVMHTDIKPQNILIETPAIREIFDHAPPEVFESQEAARDGNIMESVQVSSAQEDLAQSLRVSAKLADFRASMMSYYGRRSAP
ncbi:serine protein kinase Sky1 [Cordyceps fumosorosea ARSEF 2679]|uniref:non-specific serine/threonine protein kinase n=1 Tax=Cordyceps fumosorosea (strain ARSEF 2679) TaxID=1081104 RepID=A0A167TPB3_CORFA|nr:serine protein kinase Sky1 [Cordyceps fumosorosea ARSEF 2679]OAA60807.1 serine protein kinase Sky1 [Cordyceps fumosorosea ARSEF 2679]